MFYSTQILARKGPLGIIWIAAHMDKNLKRSQVAGAHIPGTVDALLDPEAPLALRLSGQLLLGVVRVYSRQLSFLQQDCQDALIRIRLTINADRQGGATATLLLPGGSSQDPEEGALVILALPPSCQSWLPSCFKDMSARCPTTPSIAN
ncbi:Rec8 like protein-domain-containing protein [Dunaliella salina]|uniref:Rec8 like protein-domain-containing protein n=1 Tax=Dunaliella salina TaxID=3046 RepID=A0ABQ7H064_DUNSA|nr:Rec8 like protein-domain-containing protein [Dunaliella salina]|eukprot:KAF5840211.1 Rec8 like protein-domain-containing protein [Dunaliella salina]